MTVKESDTDDFPMLHELEFTKFDLLHRIDNICSCILDCYDIYREYRRETGHSPNYAYVHYEMLHRGAILASRAARRLRRRVERLKSNREGAYERLCKYNELASAEILRVVARICNRTWSLTLLGRLRLHLWLRCRWHPEFFTPSQVFKYGFENIC